VDHGPPLLTPSMKKTAIALYAVIAVFFMPSVALGATVSSQLLNDTQFPNTAPAFSSVEYRSDVGLLPAGQSITGVQYWFSGGVSSNGALEVWLSENDYKTNNTANRIAQLTYSGCTQQSSGLTDCTLSTATTTQSSRYYVVLASLLDPAIDPTSPSAVLGTTLATGRTLLVDGGTATTPNGRALYWQLYSGTAQVFFTPDPNATGFASSTVNTLCNDNFATSTSFIDSIASNISNGMCRVVVFLFVPSSSAINQYTSFNQTLQSKIPFSYFYDLATLYDSVVGTSSPTFIDVSFDISSTTVASTSFGSFIPSITAFSTTTISEYLSPTFLSLLRSLMVSALYLGFAYVAFRRVSGLLSKPK